MQLAREIHAAQKRLDTVNADLSLIDLLLEIMPEEADIAARGRLQLEAANLTALVCELERRYETTCKGA